MSQTPVSAAMAALIATSARANDALMRGEIDTYNALIRLAPDFVLMSPFGGAPSRGSDYTPDRIAAMGRFFRNGALTQEVVASWAGADTAVLATIERPLHVEVGDLPAQDWALRVTQVYRRGADGWTLIHRHADPLGHGISHATAAALGRGAI
jgi:ketosteroid isomerase-like protein